MEEIKRIKEIMNIREDKMPRTAPIGTAALLKVIQYTLSNYNDKVSFDNLSPQNPFLDNIFTNLNLVGVKNVTENEVDDYVFTFIKDNSSLLDDGNFNPEEYMIPQKKKFEWDGREKYNEYKADYYSDEIEGYSEDFIRHLFDVEEMNVTDGKYVDSESYDINDTEQVLDDIKEIPFNESISENLRLLQEIFTKKP